MDSPGIETAPRKWPVWIVGVLVGVYLAVTLYKFSPLLTDQHLIVDDMGQHISAIYSYSFSDAQQADLLMRYKQTYLPVGFRVLYRSASLVIDPLLLARILTFVLIGLTWWLCWCIGNRLGGPIGGWLTVLLAAHAEYLAFEQFGGLFRAFGHPLILWFIYEWIRDRKRVIPWVLLLQSMFYPPVFLVCTGAYGLFVLFNLGDWWENRRRLVFLGSVVFAGLLIVGVLARKPEAFGPVAMASKVNGLQEWGAGGRFPELPFKSVPAHIGEGILKGLASSTDGEVLMPPLVDWHAKHGHPMAWLYVLVSAGILFWKRPRFDWLLAMGSASLLLYLVSRFLAFHLGWPDRFLFYPFSLLCILLFPLAWSALEGKGRGIFAAAMLSGILLCYPFGFTGEENYKTVSTERHAGMIEFMKTLPEDTLVAGWPRQDMDYVLLLARKPVLVDYESTHPIYMDYYHEMVERIEETIRLHFVSFAEDAIRIRDRYGLTHFVVRKRTVDSPGSGLPNLYTPLREFAASQKKRAVEGGTLFFANPPAESLVYEDEMFRVIDLRKL